MSSLPDLDHAGLANLFRKRIVSPVESTRQFCDRLEEIQPQINFVVSFDRDKAFQSALESEQRWKAGTPLSPYDGLIATIKANIAVKGWPRQQGSAVSPAAAMDFDAPAVARMREAGVIIAATTTMPEFGWKGLSDSPLTGQTYNPWNKGRSTGAPLRGLRQLQLSELAISISARMELVLCAFPLPFAVLLAINQHLAVSLPIPVL